MRVVSPLSVVTSILVSWQHSDCGSARHCLYLISQLSSVAVLAAQVRFSRKWTQRDQEEGQATNVLGTGICGHQQRNQHGRRKGGPTVAQTPGLSGPTPWIVWEQDWVCCYPQAGSLTTYLGELVRGGHSEEGCMWLGNMRHAGGTDHLGSLPILLWQLGHAPFLKGASGCAHHGLSWIATYQTGSFPKEFTGLEAESQRLGQQLWEKTVCY